MSSSYVGIDIHKKRCVFTEINADGKIISRGSFGNHRIGIKSFRDKLSCTTAVVVEPTLNYLWLSDYLESHVASLHVAVPSKVRVIAEAKNKSDRYDSRILAELLRTNFLPETFRLPAGIRELRELVRQRAHFVKHQTMLKNRIRRQLFSEGWVVQASDISSPKAKREIADLELSSLSRELIASNQALLSCLKLEIKQLESRLKQGWGNCEAVVLLRTISGVGAIRSLVIYGEIVDISRFRSGKALSSYTGLVPRVRQSGEKCYHGSITRAGSRPLRYALIEAAISAAHASKPLRQLYYRVLSKKDKATARVAVGHKLALIIYAMLTRREAFRSN